MTVKFWTDFSKRINSTKIPATAGIEKENVRLKQDCSEHDPVIILSSNEYGYVYAYISAWGKYYFVRDVVSLANNLVEYHLSEDVLASYKNDISNTKAHIAYTSNSSYYNKRIIDPRLHVENHRTLYYDEPTSGSAFPSGLSDGGSYLLTVFNNNASLESSGMSVTYLLSQSGMTKVRAWFADNLDPLTQYFHGTPLSAILSCIWVPYAVEASTTASAIYIGDMHSSIAFQTGEISVVNGFPITEKHFTMPLHLAHNDPQASDYHTATDFRDQEPYTTAMLYLPGAGFVQISLGDWFDVKNIQIQTLIENITGNVRYNLWRHRTLDEHLVYQYSELVQTVDCCVAAQCPLGQIQTNATGTMSSIGTMVGGAVGLVGSIAATVATEGAAAPLIAASAGTLIAGAANTALAANQHATTVTGTNGSRMASKYKYFKYYEARMDMEDPDGADYIAIKGRPCGQTMLISDLVSGFVQCEGASVACKGNMVEKQEINTYLNSGFYYE